MRLKTRYDAMNTEQRSALAAAAGIGPEYLYQLANRFRGKKPSLDVLTKLAAADRKLKVADMVAEFAETPNKAA